MGGGRVRVSTVAGKIQDTVSLTDRIEANKQSSDSFDEWTRGLLEGVKFNSVLDICCGTGKQLAIYSDMGIADITGVDIAQESLNVAKGSVPGVTLKCCPMETAFDGKKYDLISCFYGLYYCTDTKWLIGEILAHLNPGGTVLIVGPYGDNNKALFDLLETHYTLPRDVIYSCRGFMDDVVKWLDCKIEQQTFINRVSFPDAGALYKYWKATTFYSDKHDQAVRKHIERVFEEQGGFTVEKHVKAIRGTIDVEGRNLSKGKENFNYSGAPRR